MILRSHGILGQGPGQDKLRRNFQGRVVLKLGIRPGLKRDSPPRIAMIGIQNLDLRVKSVFKFMEEIL